MKRQLRNQIIKRRNQLSPPEIGDKSAQIYRRLRTLAAFQSAQSIMVYMDYKNEVQTKSIIDDCFVGGKAVIVPVVTSKNGDMSLVEIGPQTHFKKSSLGILEPQITAQSRRQLGDIDLILAPGVAFDLTGNRLGYGGGYYDRLLAKAPAERRRIAVYGLAFECQIVESIPTEPTDCKIDGLITERQIYQF